MATNITIMGYGTMGKAIAKILTKQDSSVKIFTIDIDKKNWNGFSKSDFIILSVKPQDAISVLKELKNNKINKKTILISIMAGFTIKKISQLSQHKKIIRMMPNLGLSVGAGIAVWKKSGLSQVESIKTKNFINKITDNFEVKDEDTINKVTALSGSGPAYFFLLADSLIKTSKKLGFTEEESKKLIHKTFLASSLLSKDSDFSSLIKKVTSKGGTTEAALKVFKKEKFEKIINKAVFSAYKRAKELSQNLP